MFVGIRYEEGDATLTTYPITGAQVGVRTDAGYEYNLYDEAVRLYADCPSACYELLRFGRVLGPDVLAPADASHWRQVCYPDGEGWVNLKSDNIHVFSDADFPHWRGWYLVDDAQDANSRCDSAAIISLLDVDEDGSVSRREAEQRLQSDRVRDFLKRLICKFPTEWDNATIDARWDWLCEGSGAEASGNLIAGEAESFTDDDFTRLRAHLEALGFWDAGAIGLDGNHWHFEPREFIRHFRRCLWLSADDLSRTLSSAPASGRARAEVLRLALNKMQRKYQISTSQRVSHFLAQVGQETGWWQYRDELGNCRIPHDHKAVC